MGSIYKQKTYSQKSYQQKGISNKDFLHPTTRAYVQKFIAAGLPIPDNINEVDQFVKQLSLLVPPSSWIAWPLRSSHNAGTGTTVYSLGNYRKGDGIFINSPTWGANGINFPIDGNTAINTMIRLGMAGTAVVIGNPAGIAGTSGQHVLASQRLGSTAGWGLWGYLAGNTACVTFGSVSGSNASTANTFNAFGTYFAYWEHSHLQSLARIAKNNGPTTTVITSERSPEGSGLVIGNEPASAVRSAGGEIALVIVFGLQSFNIERQGAALINILKNTVCKGLALP